MRTFLPLGCGIFLVLSGVVAELHAAGPVIVHEWGTFTSLQDENGKAIDGINVDDEPVPGFVWRVAGARVVPQYSQENQSFGLPPYGSGIVKGGFAAGNLDVTMRLETPVLYIYPPKGQAASSMPPLDVHVDFHGGVLSEYYPYAHVDGVQYNGDMPYVTDKLKETTTTGLTWKGVRLGATGQAVPSEDKFFAGEEASYFRGKLRETADQVWTTPREVSAPLLQVNFPVNYQNASHDGIQSERFLFYRGVGHLDSPLHVWNINSESNIKQITSPTFTNEDSIASFDQGWMVEILPEGQCAFRWINKPHVWLSLGSHFADDLAPFSKGNFSADNLTQLKASMQAALEKEGLYPDEASAMLRTWELSYFKSPGLRFFYIVPRTWTDKVLPLKITGAPTEITRVMVGRIELITDAQKAALARLAAGPCPDLPAVKKAAEETLAKSTLPKDEVDAFYRGDKPLRTLGISIPPLVQDYLSLGRFRDALIMHEQQLHPSAALAQFIKDNGIAAERN